jgi:hypothetical protein
MKISDFAGRGPGFDPAAAFVGPTEGWGVMETPLGHFQKRFTVSADGAADAEGRIRWRETWSFDDGHVDSLNWEIWPQGEGRFAGREDRIEGEAEGEAAGFAFYWRYTRDTPQPDGKSIKLNFDDWFFQIDPDVFVARGSAGRVGLPFAVAHVTYRKIRG